MNNELFSRLKDLAQKENRTRLAVLLGAAAHPAGGAVHPFREDRRSKRRPGG